jgi:hypothetical protein
MVRTGRDEAAHAPVARERLTLADFKDPARRVEEVPWPGTDRKVGLLCPLSCAELQAAHFAAVEHFRKAVQPMDTITSMQAWTEEKDRQELYLMLLQPGSRRPTDRLFKSADDVRKGLDSEEVVYFQNCYAVLNARRLVELGIWPVGKEIPPLPYKAE